MRVGVRSLDSQIEIRAVKVVAPGPRAKQDDPPDFRHLAKLGHESSHRAFDRHFSLTIETTFNLERYPYRQYHLEV